jgi:hypothetical protein
MGFSGPQGLEGPVGAAGPTGPAGSVIRGMAREMPDVRSDQNAWIDVPGRTVSFAKHAETSALLVTYQDSFGALEVSWGTQCRWRLVVDGSVAGREQWNYSDVQRGWQISSRTMSWLLPGIGVGSHAAKVQVHKSTSAQVCLNGFENGQQENFLLVQELNVTH